MKGDNLPHWALSKKKGINFGLIPKNVVIMEVTAAVLHGGKLAHYDVQIENNGVCKARLSDYKGNPENTPPQSIVLMREGRHWTSDVADRSLVDDLGYAVEIKVKPLLESRRRDGSHPAG